MIIKGTRLRGLGHSANTGQFFSVAWVFPTEDLIVVAATNIGGSQGADVLSKTVMAALEHHGVQVDSVAR
jgi:hypothetical protein